jgi:uncharacterized protein YkwD
MTSKSLLIALIAFASIASEALSNDLFRRVAEMVNDERQEVGLKRLAYNEKLEQAALSHSQWMARVGKMEHLQGARPQSFEEYIRSDHIHATRILKTGYLEGNGGQIRPKPDVDDHSSEIIAFAGQGTGSIQQQLPIVVPGWMKSPGHRAVIVKTCWKDIGGAFAISRNSSIYYCVTFGNPVE